MLTLTADGCQEVAELPDTGCCPPSLCGSDLCCTFVAFFQLLPSGPIWDYWKRVTIEYFQRNQNPLECPLLTNPACPSIVLHAIYTVLKFRKMVADALWPALRESDPMTAVTTLDAWLKRLQWEDCFLQACRSRLLGGITPYEINSDCGPLFCPPNFPPELVAALKHNIIRSLVRANMGVIKNLCGLSWVIEPLGARVQPVLPYVSVSLPSIICESTNLRGVRLMVVAVQNWIEGAGTGDICERKPKPRVAACFDRGCDIPAGLPSQIWPALLAAECIIRSLAAEMVCKTEVIALVSPPCAECTPVSHSHTGSLIEAVHGVDAPDAMISEPCDGRDLLWFDITSRTTDNYGTQNVAVSGDGSTIIRSSSGVSYDDVNISHDGGATFVNALTTEQCWSACSANGSVILLGITSTVAIPANQIQVSTNGGATWTPHAIPAMKYARSASVSGDGSKMIVGGIYTPMGDGKVYISLDSGVTWTPRTPYAWLDGADWVDGVKISRDGSTMYVNTSRGGSVLAKSIDNGATWVNVSPKQPTDLTINAPDSTNNYNIMGFACSANGQVLIAYENYDEVLYVSTNGGTSWVERSPLEVTWGVSGGGLCMSDDGMIFYAITDNYVYKSTDQGVTWVAQAQADQPCPSYYVQGVACSANGKRVVMFDDTKLWLGNYP